MDSTSSVSAASGGAGGRISRSSSRPMSPDTTSVRRPRDSTTLAAPSRWPAGISVAFRPLASRSGSLKSTGCSSFQRALGIGHRVQRLGRRVLGVAVAVGERGLLLLQVGAVAQHHLGQPAGARRGPHRPAVAGPHQRRQPAAVVEVGVGEDHRVELARRDARGRAVAQPQRLVALEHAAVDQQPCPRVVEQVARSGDGVGRACEGEFHVRSRLLVSDDGTQRCRGAGLRQISLRTRACRNVRPAGSPGASRRQARHRSDASVRARIPRPTPRVGPP